MLNDPDVTAKTKILVTLGPATNTVELISELIRSGIDGIRLNLSHCTYEFLENIFGSIHSACSLEKSPLAVLIDLQGPKIRIGELDKSSIELQNGKSIEITIDDIIGNEKIISTSYKELVDDAEIGNEIFINDGLIKLVIKSKTKQSVLCEVVNGGILTSHKGMNLPGMKLSTPSITKKDYENLEFIIKHRVDYIALSFVRSADDVLELKDWLAKKGKNIPVIAKIEKKEAVDNLFEIIMAADGIMIARGDLGVELPPQQVPVLQKSIIKQCNALGKLVITATQMLESMINSPIPTRAEASDVANAVWDGTDVVMLSGETSVGKYPIKAVQIMNDIVIQAEQHAEDKITGYFISPDNLQDKLFDSVGKAVVDISKQINAQAIVVFTFEGRTARIISKYKPDAKIIGISNSFNTMNNLCLRWGVTSIYHEQINKEHLEIADAKQLILESNLAKKGDLIIFTAGAPYSEKSRANWLRFEVL
ncbi:MAG: pyruvate kinase [Ignavibacterium sp.]|jgi:pyruvate kinase|nr:MAG: pyruvate kinase [Ignavibacterium sp.]MDD5607954.1 pyruvate kinase [Ignavibacterium sp.]MDX9711229.1 pyruvate kinase [Ignavibacteriaceae bacterium]MEB2353641.1 pyruvate kinase [Ignavibacteriales bacterium]GIK20794.1 MAG: pyruvate kinase [Ignavibacteriota bacterium]